MREKLKKKYLERETFTGTFVRTGKKNSFGYTKETLLFSDIQDKDGVVVADHLWFAMGKQFTQLKLQTGDKVKFDARIKSYRKGYKGYREDVFGKPVTVDYKLSHPTKIKKL